MLLIRDGALYFQEVGKGDSLLFIHGIAGDANTWDEHAAELAAEFRCVAYDRRGHTRSPRGAIASPSVEVDADDAAEVVTALGLAPVIIVGCDQGSEIGLDLVRQYPSLIRGAILCDPPVDALAHRAARKFRTQMVAELREAPTPRAAVDVFFAYASGTTWTRLSERRREAARSNCAAMLASLDMPPYALTPDDLRRIAVPVRVITGTRSAPFVQRAARTLVRHLPNAELMELEGVASVAYFDRPGAFTDAVRSFAQRLTRSTM
jgi:pimeloyl-ACP methyl ester carboxylesterase